MDRTANKWHIYILKYIIIRVIFSSNVSKERPIEVLGTIRSQPKSVPQSKDRISQQAIYIYKKFIQ
jgi:hypothetical protein